MGVWVGVGFKDSVGVQNGQNLTSGAFGTQGFLRPLATDCRLEAHRGGGSWRPGTRRVPPPPPVIAFGKAP